MDVWFCIEQEPLGVGGTAAKVGERFGLIRVGGNGLDQARHLEPSRTYPIEVIEESRRIARDVARQKTVKLGGSS